MKVVKTLGIILIFCLFQTSLILSQDLSDLTLIAHYPLTSTANDTTGNYGPMTLINTPFQDGGIYCNGNYLFSDPDSCDAITPDITGLNFEALAISARFKVSSYHTASINPVFICGDGWRWMGVCLLPDSLIGYIYNYTSPQNTNLKYSLDTWHLATVTYDSSKGIGKYYIDGVLADSVQFQLEHGNDKNVTITHGGHGFVFKGIFSDLKIYTKTDGTDVDSAQVVEQDSLALVALYNSTDGANWTNNSNWLTGPVSTWFGITVSDGRVTEVVLRSNNLVGTIPAEIGNLTELITLDLYTNQLAGSIPSEIGNLISLVNLSFYGNQLTGSIPSVIGNLINLTSLSLGSNQLSGTIPSEIGNLANLNYLFLSANQLSEPIPDEIGNLTNLESLYLGGNQISESIPSEIGNLTNLKTLHLNSNLLSGPIPSELYNLINLGSLRLHQNQLSDSIYSEIGNLSSLYDLWLYDNQLFGTVPAELGELTNLKYLYLFDNQFSGAIPTEIVNLTNLEKLYLYDNQFIDLPDLSPIATLTELKIQNNQFTFEDIEQNILVPNFSYSPQDSVGEEQDTIIDQGSSLELSITVGGTVNQYQWMKDGIDISGADSSSYAISSAETADEGSYLCKITNTIATELTLYSRPINVTVSGGVGVTDHSISNPKAFALYQNYPNPFNSSTVIKYDLPEASIVVLKIYNLFGQEIKTLANELQTAGEKKILWNGLNVQGQKVSSGIYVYKIKTESFSKSNKMIMIK